ncbi:MAG: NAD(P)-binding domain-containing protein, partial [Boseongicola sp.]|nr:NAD(P)-binding domain-containing protein [Boseongicola sp.]
MAVRDNSPARASPVSAAPGPRFTLTARRSRVGQGSTQAKGREDTMAKCAFLGLGVMGFPMAGHLKAAGHEVTVFNRTSAKAEDWADKHAGSAAKTPREAAKGADFVMACVGNDDDLRSICLGDDGAFAGMSSGSVFVDHTTVSAAVTREMYAEADKGNISFVDAPISGGQAGAENGQL